MELDENLESLENQWPFEKNEQNCSTLIDDLYENNRHKCNESGSCDVPTSIITPTLNNDNDFCDNVTPTPHNNNRKHLNYRYQKVYQDGTHKTGYYTNTFFVDNIKEKARINIGDKLSNSIDYTHIQHRLDCNMGSNVSRNTAKGLSGRRTQSSGEFIIARLDFFHKYSVHTERTTHTLSVCDTQCNAI